MSYDYDILPDDKQVDVNRIRRARGERRGRRHDRLRVDLPEINDEGELVNPTVVGGRSEDE